MADENVSSPAIQTLSSSAQPISSPSSTPAAAAISSLAAAAPPPQVAINLQSQNYLPNQQSLMKPGSISISGAPRPFLQNVPNTSQQQQVTSPAMLVQSPPQPAGSSVPRTSSTGRISPTPAGLRPGQFTLQQQQQQQAQMLAARASQAQAGPTSQPRPTQSNQASHLQGGQLSSQGLMAASSPLRPGYQAYTQMMRPGMGGQPAIHPQYMMQARAKAGQVSSQFQGASSGVGPMPAMSGLGIPATRPSVQQQPQPAQRMQSMQTRQQQPLQPQQAQAPSSLQQKVPGQKGPSVNSIQSSLPTSQSLGGLSNLQAQTGQQAWGSKSMNQMSSAQGTYQVSGQQAALLKQGQVQYAQQMQGQLPQQASMNQQHQLGRALSSSAQRPPTPTGMQPSTPGSGTLTSALGGPTSSLESGNRILGKRSIQELVAQVDPSRCLDPEVEDFLLEVADDFIESVTTFACKLAKHRKSNVLEAKDILLHLNRNWDISIPGFDGEEYHAYRKPNLNETHKQRLAVIKKSITSQQAGDSAGANVKASNGSGQPPSVLLAGPQAPANS